MPQPTVAVLIVTYNSEKDIPRLVGSLGRTDYSSEHICVYIADNNSDDLTLQLLHTYTSTLPFEYAFFENKKNFGFDVANNELYEQAKQKKNPDYVVLLNPDTVVDKNWLNELIACMEADKNVGAAQSLLLLHEYPDKINSAGNELFYCGIGYVGAMGAERTTAEKNGVHDIGYASGAAVCYRASVLNETGLFYPDFFYMEDADLSWRIRLLGYRVIVCPQSVVWHNYRYSKGIYKMKAIELNRHKIVLQNYRVATLVILSPLLLMFEFMVIAMSIRQGWWKEKFRNYSEILKMIAVIRKRHAQVASTRKISDRATLKTMALTIHIPTGNPFVLRYIINPFLALYGWFVRICIIWW
ncbi:MAG TPA: glycosyltransferase family 2 protein [Patescibacteria group bacterium]|nr:glycosyltransferase family 2 protein [Patescibacteria group bacterium]